MMMSVITIIIKKGAYATIVMNWDEDTQTFNIEAQNGEYESMPKSRKISVLKLEPGYGTGLQFNKKPQYELIYAGKKMEIKL